MSLSQNFGTLGVKKAFIQYDVVNEKFTIGVAETGRDVIGISLDGVTGNVTITDLTTTTGTFTTLDGILGSILAAAATITNLNTTGNAGIGISSPSVRLHVVADAGEALPTGISAADVSAIFQNNQAASDVNDVVFIPGSTGQVRMMFAGTGSTYFGKGRFIYDVLNKFFAWHTNGTTLAMQLDLSGNLTVAGNLDVAGAITAVGLNTISFEESTVYFEGNAVFN